MRLIALDLLADRDARVGQGREQALELRTKVLVLSREAQLLAEMAGVLVNREAGGSRRDLEQDALRLAEVDREEVVAVDHGRDLHGGLRHPSLPRDRVLVAG